MQELMICIENVSKQYRLGTIGGGTLQGDIQSWWARIRGKEDPNSKIGSKVYAHNERFLALDGVSFDVNKGERVGIIGHNGAGKSTLLKLLSRVTAPTSGEIGLNGRVASMLEVGTGFHGELTGRENVYMNGAILGMNKAEIDKKMDDIIEFSECKQFIDTPVKRYSSGMYVKLAFSVAAHLDSEIMIMDEVLAVGDMAFQNKCLSKMSDVSKNNGRTILYVSHNMNTIRQLCDRVVVLNHGKVEFDGDVETGINIYSNTVLNSNEELPLFYDCDKLRRPGQYMGNVHISCFEFVEKETPSYYEGEKIRFRLEWTANVDIEDVRVRAAVKMNNGANIGMAELSESTNARAGSSYSQIFEMNIDNLTEGLYFMKVFLYVRNATNSIIDLDPAVAQIFFKVNPNTTQKTIWVGNYWGAVRLNTIHLLESNRTEG